MVESRLFFIVLNPNEVILTLTSDILTLTSDILTLTSDILTLTSDILTLVFDEEFRAKSRLNPLFTRLSLAFKYSDLIFRDFLLV
jgi:hypothetical protein